MRTPTVLCLALCTCLTGAVQSPDDRTATDPKSITVRSNPKAGPIPLDDLFYTRAVGNPSWSPDGREIVFTTDLTGRLNLWKVSAAGGWPVQLSQSDDRQMAATWSPDGKWIVYQQDRAGGEYYDLFALGPNGGESLNITNTPDISETGAFWSRDGRYLAFDRKPKSQAGDDIAIMDWATRTVKQLTHEGNTGSSWSVEAWSKDGRTLFALRSNAGRTDSSIFRIDVSTGSAEELTPHKDRVLYKLGDVSPDGRTLLIAADEKYGATNIALLDLASKSRTWVTDLKWDAAPGEFSPDGKQFTWSVNEDGRTDLYLADSVSKRGAKLEVPPGVSSFVGDPHSFQPNGQTLLISHQDSQRPSDLWIFDLATRASRQLTFSALAGLDPDRIPPSQLVHYRSFDGMMISAFAWFPDNLKRDGSNPAIVLPHGGPTGQTLDNFNRTVAALASRGYICIAPNPRGSTGYGMTFQQANHKDLGGGDLQDEVYAARFLKDTGYVDAAKIGITGGSYGGYMTLMAIGKTPELWAAAVEQYGIINWFTMWEHEDSRLQAYQRSLMGDPVTDRNVFEANSPITFIRKTKAPLLILHGDNDIRVPKGEAVQVADILEKSGRIVSAHYYPNEGHGFVKRENQVDAIRRTIDWFDRYLKGSRN